MAGLYLTTILTGYQGLKWRELRTMGDDMKPLQAQVKELEDRIAQYADGEYDTSADQAALAPLKAELEAMQAKDAEDYNKLNAMYVDLDARNTHATNQAAKFEKELTGLHKMYNGVSGELSTALKACGQLETKLKYLEPLEEEVRRKNIEIIRLEEQVKDLSSEKKRMIEDLENSKDRIKSLTRRASMVKRGSMRSMASLLVKK